MATVMEHDIGQNAINATQTILHDHRNKVLWKETESSFCLHKIGALHLHEKCSEEGIEILKTEIW